MTQSIRVKLVYRGALIEVGGGLDVDQPNILVTLDYIETCYLGI